MFLGWQFTELTLIVTIIQKTLGKVDYEQAIINLFC